MRQTQLRKYRCLRTPLAFSLVLTACSSFHTSRITRPHSSANGARASAPASWACTPAKGSAATETSPFCTVSAHLTAPAPCHRSMRRGRHVERTISSVQRACVRRQMRRCSWRARAIAHRCARLGLDRARVAASRSHVLAGAQASPTDGVSARALPVLSHMKCM